MAHPVLDPRLGVVCFFGVLVLWCVVLVLLYGLLPEYADNLRAALKTGDIARMHRVAHGLAGASSYCGTVAVHAAAKQLEALCLHENASALREPVNAVLHHIDRLMYLRHSGHLPAADGDPIY